MKNILVTGAGTGFGKLYTIELAKRGHAVHAGVEITSQITQLREELSALGLKANVFKLDICNEYDRNYASHLDIDILVNNAGVGQGGAIVDMPSRVLHNQFEVNFFATIEITNQILRSLVKKKQGRLVFISSIAGLLTGSKSGAYCASKHALEAAVGAIKEEVKSYGITVSTINPGPYLTGFNDRLSEAAKMWYDPENSLVNHDDLSFPMDQYPPEQDLQAMVDVIENDDASFRNVFPKDLIPFVQEYQAKLWKA